MPYQAKTTFQGYYKSGKVVSRGCNAICFENHGDVVFYINHVYKMEPGAGALSINQDSPDHRDITEYEIRFDAEDILSTGTEKKAIVITTFLTKQDSVYANDL